MPRTLYALLVGIDKYRPPVPPLGGCVRFAREDRVQPAPRMPKSPGRACLWIAEFSSAKKGRFLLVSSASWGRMIGILGAHIEVVPVGEPVAGTRLFVEM